MQNCSVALFRAKELSYGHSYTLDFSGDMPQGFHNRWSFLLVKSGEFSYSVDGTTYDIIPDSLILYRPRSLCTLRAKGTITYDRHIITISEDLLDKEILKQLPPDLQVLDVSNNLIIQNIFEKIHFYMSTLQEKQLESLLRAFANELVFNIYANTRTSYKTVKHKTDPLLASILLYISDHIREPLTVSQISNAMSISTGYLHLFFSKNMNTTIKKYITLQKLLHIQKALANNVNPTEACRQYGFRSYSTFYRNYQAVFGCRPSDNPEQSLQKIDL